ncbi:MAG TPA: aminotransferase class III-fold pyridoxal phosphate-dependent enzyme [Steroidobacteraceae bacterium]|nr:aminotransferase class III-fold pyridoxal phosphate-dependent enzyme [Steroidobacteraceae bacterium]
MNVTPLNLVLIVLGALLAVWLLRKAQRRLVLSRAKHRSLAGHSKWSRRLAKLVPFYEYDENEFFCADGAPREVATQRRAAFDRLAALYAQRFAKSAQASAEIAGGVSDVQFTSRYRVPFQFSSFVRKHLKGGNFLQSSQGSTVIDLDGNELYDLTGSYGVNVFGTDFYKGCIERGAKLVADLGPVLGSFHPVLAYNVRRLREISGLDEVSFHMSGTEAVMQAVRLARYHTRRTHLVRFCGAYHGWWGDVQPGIGNPITAHETYTLADMSAKSLKVLRTRTDIACVLVNPLQAMHPNGNAPSDSMLLDSGRKAHFDRDAYRAWLLELREVCTARNIVLIFDEVFMGFRLAAGGAQEYFGVRADLVTYGKTLGGGLPVGVLCGRKDLMKRFREDAPADVCFARGTFNSHPYVMGAMHEFLVALESESVRAKYIGLDATWNRRAGELNATLAGAGLPLQVVNFQSIWSLLYTRPSRYNWMLQYYLRAAGLALSWVGTGRLIFRIDLPEDDFAQIARRIVDAAAAMERDGWWWTAPELTNAAIRRRVRRETLRARGLFRGWGRSALPSSSTAATSNKA